MTYDIYYLVFGIKLDVELVDSMLNYLIDSGDFEDYFLKYYDDNCDDLKEYLIESGLVDQVLNEIWNDIESPYDGNGGCDIYIGKIVKQTDVSGTTKTKISKGEKHQIIEKINAIKDCFPEEIQEMFPEPGFVSVHGTS